MKIIIILFLSSALFVFICSFGHLPQNRDNEIYFDVIALMGFVGVGVYVSKHIKKMFSL
ncbi:hypothetical protein ADIARSV_3104 [Arcticibacter svalbardensis MN12-7]|uniref:Uncharacterized protein n=1 Tax=Arcticibacter svalbardensis MN12-7 TaxID=1150600 RepID=R9GXS8_9SPHI|nr:hypothetical protein ADIARSV_3104 [Arcticibacter svalbardensis MN12-7]